MQTTEMIISLTTFGANFGQLSLERAVARTHSIRLKEILKRRALFPAGRQVIPSFYPETSGLL